MAKINRIWFVVAALVATVLLPFLLRPSSGKSYSKAKEESLVILTPHVESIRHEFGEAFARHMAEKYARNVSIEWRAPGGTSEIDKYLDTEFRAVFENFWKSNPANGAWKQVYASAVSATKLADDASEEVKAARKLFLNSQLGVKLDLFFGGGVYDFDKQKKKGYLVATDSTGTHGFADIQKAHPEWFSEAVIPETFAGEKFRDPDYCWVGATLSAFGIIYNKDGLERHTITRPPAQWEDLTNPQYSGAVALADPSKSGSAAKAFEMILQQEIQRAMQQVGKPTAPTSAALVGEGLLETEMVTAEQAIRQGWTKGLQIIQRIGANARYFTDAAPKPPMDVSKGEATAGMCIDFYGRTFVEKLSRIHKNSRVVYLTPKGGSAVSVDPIAMFRGAPNAELATRFIEFVLSPEGQRIWCYRVGTPGGPQRTALRRLPVRKDLYAPAELVHFSDPQELPYQNNTFTYHPEYTAAGFNSLRVIIRAMCIDNQEELRAAWAALQKAKFPPRATASFQEMHLVHYDKVMGGMAKIMSGGDKVAQNRLANDLASEFRNNYNRAKGMAERGE